MYRNTLCDCVPLDNLMNKIFCKNIIGTNFYMKKY